MQRYNGFNQIHKALRAMLFHTAATLQQTDPADRDATTAAIEKTTAVLQLFHAHAGHEDAFILPLLQKIKPALITTFEREHEEDEALSLHLDVLLLSFKNALSEESRETIWYNICKAFYAFTAFNLYHMNKEEDTILPVLWAHISDEELLAVTRAIVSNIDMEEMMLSNKWMLLGLNNTEISNWLNAVRIGSPEFVFSSLLQQAQITLPEKRFAQIENKVNSNNSVPV